MGTRGILAISAAVVGIGVYTWLLRRHNVAPPSDAGYLDAASCTGCHRQIWESYRKTGMGRSFSRPRPGSMVEDFAKRNTFYHRPSDRYYQLYEKDGRYFQRRHQIGFDGRETNVVDKEIHFIVGSGNHARTYLHRTRDGRIFELPVAWYAENGGYWAMNPGYDQPNHYDFRRQILQECVFCHTAYPEIPAGADRVGSEPRFPGRLPEGIDCQRCHGPGRRHVEAVQAGQKGAIRETIVNPARFTPEQQLELCMQCHLETSSRRLPHSILRYERGAFSYRPGEPLAAYALHFDHAPGTGHDDKFEIAHHAYRLRKSACFERSAGRLTCTTCHNPHTFELRPTACTKCHATPIAHHPTPAPQPASAACAACHMPKRRTEDVVHVSMTDHFIQRRKPPRDLLAPLQERLDAEATAYQGPVVPYYPPAGDNDLYVAVAQVKQFSNLKEGIPRLRQALQKHPPQHGGPYFELAEAYAKVGQAEEAIRFYEAAIRRTPDFRPAYAGLGRILSEAGQHTRAVEVLRKALEMGPRDPTVLNDLGLVHLQQKDLRGATAMFRAAIEQDPAYSEAFSNLGGVLGETGDPAGAEAAYREAIRMQPDSAAAHTNLADLLASRGDTRQAQYHYQKALYHNPNYAPAHYNFALALAGTERYEEARVQFEAAIRLDPARAEAHNGLADMLALQGKAAQAIGHYERALALKSDLAAASLGLGSALAAQGRRLEAVAHLEKAAESSDAAVKTAAQETLRRLGR